MPSTNGIQVVGSKDLPHTGCEYSLSSWHQYRLQKGFSQQVCKCASFMLRTPILRSRHSQMATDCYNIT